MRVLIFWQRLSPLLRFVLIGTVFELLYLLVFALAPLSTTNIQPSPIATAWPWTLAPSKFLFQGAWNSSGGYSDRGPYFLLLGLACIALAIVYLYAVGMALRASSKTGISSRWLFLAMAGATVFGITLLFLPALFSNDVFSYIFTGRVLTIYHADPLTTAPAHFHQDPYLPWIAQPTVPGIYGPLWMAIASFLVRTANSPVAALLLFKGLALLFHLINCALIWVILGKLAPSRRLVGTLVYAWNPLALIELAGNGHNDGVLICLLLLATWLYVQQKGGWYEVGAVALLGLASSANLIALLVIPLFIWSSVRTRRDTARAIWSFCWMALIALAVLFITYLPYWHGSATFVAITSSTDMQHFVHSPMGTLAVPLGWLYSQISQGANFPSFYMQPAAAANTTLLAVGLFIFTLIYFYLLGKIRGTPVTPAGMPGDTPGNVGAGLAPAQLALSAYIVFVSGSFWPWYVLWTLWIVALRRFDALTVSVLLLSCTALLTYPLLYLDSSPIAVYQPLLIFGIPLLYLIANRKRRNERKKLVYDRRSKTA